MVKLEIGLSGLGKAVRRDEDEIETYVARLLVVQ